VPATKLNFNDAFAKTDSAALAQMVRKTNSLQQETAGSKDAKGTQEAQVLVGGTP